MAGSFLIRGEQRRPLQVRARAPCKSAPAAARGHLLQPQRRQGEWKRSEESKTTERRASAETPTPTNYSLRGGDMQTPTLMNHTLLLNN